MKKLIFILTCIASLSVLGQSPPVSTRASTLAWDSVTETNLTTAGYDVAVAFTNVVLSTANTLPNVGGGVFATARVFGQSNTNLALVGFVPNSMGVDTYNYWVRTVASHSAITNYLVSDWTNLTSLYLKNPNSPKNVFLR